MSESPAQETQAFENTDRELWREGDGDGDGMSYYEPSIHVTKQGRIGINVGGNVFVLSLREWHALASADLTTEQKPAEEWTCPNCSRPLHGYRGPLCRYCDPNASSE
jgi:hypothetical protein